MNWIRQSFRYFKKHERIVSALGLVSGLIVTPLTLTRIDSLEENLWVGIHLALAIIGIITIHYHDRLISGGRILEEKRGIINFWFTLIIQFAFGNIFTTYAVFYFRSALFSVSWPFLLIIFFILIGNELWKKHYSRLVFQISVVFLAIYLFAIYMLPVFFGRIGDDLFVWSGLCSLVIIVILVLVLRFFARENIRGLWRQLFLLVMGIFGVVNLLYFLNVIPPIPLSLKDARICSDIGVSAKGEFNLTCPESSWRDNIRVYQPVVRSDDTPVFVYTSIFSPANFATQIIHEWQYLGTDGWKTTDYIGLAIMGGRDNGYRTYSFKKNLKPGQWRVNVLTENGLLIGRVGFDLIIELKD